MAHLVVIRHGPTTYNDAGKLRGWLDPELTAEGLQLAAAVAAQLSQEHKFDFAWSSDLKRARQTAQAMGNFATTPALRPWNVGSFAGQSHEAVHEKLLRYQKNGDLRVPFGESWNEFVSRLQAFVRTLRGTQLLVTHYRCCKLLMAWQAGGWETVDMDVMLADDVKCGDKLEFSTPW